MTKAMVKIGLFLTAALLLVSCSHQSASTPSYNRYIASKDCPVKGEYHSYFDEVEKCLEK